MNDKYKEKVNSKSLHKEFSIWCDVMVNIRKKIFWVATYNKLKMVLYINKKIIVVQYIWGRFTWGFGYITSAHCVDLYQHHKKELGGNSGKIKLEK